GKKKGSRLVVLFLVDTSIDRASDRMYGFPISLNLPLEPPLILENFCQRVIVLASKYISGIFIECELVV
ncbi:hypothetical protein NZA98_07375, partial [Escherichia coli]|nr:hypothetical protein [Escherichia coli]